MKRINDNIPMIVLREDDFFVFYRKLNRIEDVNEEISVNWFNQEF